MMILFPFYFSKYVMTDHDNYDLKWGPKNPRRYRVYDWACECYWSRRQQ